MFQKQNKRETYSYFVFNNLEVLSEEHDDFQLIKTSFRSTSSCCQNNLKIKSIFKVHPKQQSRKPDAVEGDNILLFHGTPWKNVPGILRDGFKPSVTGAFGPGVYHSNFFSMCETYANKNNPNDDSYFYFINEIPYKYVTELSAYDYIVGKALPKSYCHKYLSDQNQQELYVRDSNGSCINIAQDDTQHYVPIYVASNNIVVPKYLVHAKRGMKKLVNTNFSMPIYFVFKLLEIVYSSEENLVFVF